MVANLQIPGFETAVAPDAGTALPAAGIPDPAAVLVAAAGIPNLESALAVDILIKKILIKILIKIY